MARAVNPGIPDCFAIPKSRDYDRVIPRTFSALTALEMSNFYLFLTRVSSVV